MPTTVLTLKTTAPRLLVGIGALFFLAASFVCARWLVANAVASSAQYKEISEIAVSIAPSDPKTRLVHASLLEKTFFPEDLPRALSEYEHAVAAAPMDYALWLELGRARARIGDNDGAETALRRSLALAPNYSRVIWNLGNFLLRRNQTDEAFRLIRSAADSDPQFATPAVTNAWQVFDADFTRVRELAGDSQNLKSAFALFLSKQKRFDESVEIWNSLPGDVRNAELKPIGDEIVREMIAAHRYRDAAAMSAGRFRVGALENPSFETKLTLQSPSDFEWRILDGQQPQILIDAGQKHDGAVGIVMFFTGSDASSFRSLAQTVAVEPGKSYVLNGFVKTDLKASATVRWAVTNPADGKLVAESDAVDAVADWKEFSVPFQAPAGADGVVVSLKRAPCTSACAITGKVWFDGFRLSEK